MADRTLRLTISTPEQQVVDERGVLALRARDHFTLAYLFSRAETIYAGTSEVQLDVIAQRILQHVRRHAGLPAQAQGLPRLLPRQPQRRQHMRRPPRTRGTGRAGGQGQPRQRRDQARRVETGKADRQVAGPAMVAQRIRAVHPVRDRRQRGNRHVHQPPRGGLSGLRFGGGRRG